MAPPAGAAVAAAGSRAALLALTLLSSSGLSLCAGPPRGGANAPGDVGGDAVAALRDWENGTRATNDFARSAPSDATLGADPYALRALPAAASPAAFVGVLRGRGALVALDADLRELDRVAAPASPDGVAVAADGEVLVVGELSDRVARYRVRAGRIEPAGAVVLPGVRAMRDVAAGPEGAAYVVEEHDGRLIAMTPGREGADEAPAARADVPLCHGPFRVQRTPRHVVVDCLLDHAIVVRPVDARGFPAAAGESRIVHDGPMWGMDALEAPDGALLVAVGGVEDHPLDRTQGSFAFIDSYVTLYRWDPGELAGGGAPAKLAETNTSALGLVTPKVVKLAWRPAPGGLDLTVAGYATDRLLTLSWSRAPAGGDALGDPAVASRTVPPGSTAALLLADGGLAIANPLVDAWVKVPPQGGGGGGGRAADVQSVEDGVSKRRSVASRVGEALFFTTLMAPWNKSEGRLSRFTCETCHWEGYVDGRNHDTGRKQGEVHVRATTKPLLGLMSNRPHFSRALDPDMATMVNAEFGVAGSKSDHDPWFAVRERDFPWLADVGVPEGSLPPEALRRSLMTFMMEFTHRTNPSVAGRTTWTPVERRGAAVFRDRCESCHEARLVADEPSSRVPFDAWEEDVMSPSDAIVWAHADYEKTGVEPYVNDKGARVVSLRRLYKKHPYFTNATARDLPDVLDKARFAGSTFYHENAPDGAAALTADEKTALAAFLDLL
jgi:hypothetical protein